MIEHLEQIVKELKRLGIPASANVTIQVQDGGPTIVTARMPMGETFIYGSVPHNIDTLALLHQDN